MKQRIFGHQPKCTGSLASVLVLATDLTYKIAVQTTKIVAQYPNIFELGSCDYGVAIDSLLQHILLGNVGLSELITITRNGNFLTVFDICCGFSVYRNQVDPSSIVRLRPYDTIVSNGAVLLKNEAKADIADFEIAEKELIDKIDKSALMVFPENSQSIFSMTTFPNKICIYSIDYDIRTTKFTTSPLKTFDMRHMRERVKFVQDIFKIAQWMSTVKKSHSPFHLVPNLRIRTPNGHHVTWTKSEIHKELKILTRTGPYNMKSTLQRIKVIYEARLPNVEWGTVEGKNILKVTRVGFLLQRAILASMISRDKAVADITQGKMH